MDNQEDVLYLLHKLEMMDIFFKRINESIVGYRTIIGATLEKYQEVLEEEHNG